MTNLERQVLHVVYAHGDAKRFTAEDIALILGRPSPEIERTLRTLDTLELIDVVFGDCSTRTLGVEVLDFCRWSVGLPSLLEYSREQARDRLHGELDLLMRV